ncbi:MAG TPA: hypothetical protein VK841_23455 [Polyangiaceae bacterium]|nr:hypothetical protein [Polyangiaceae bacterium]
MKNGAIACMVISCVLAAPVRAFADGGTDVAATALFDEGRKLMAAHQYNDACPKFAESERLAPSGGTLINLAQCYEHTGQTASAWLAWKDAAARASAAGKDDAEKSALHHAALLEPALAKLTIVVDPASNIAGLEVKRDGVVLGHAEFGVPIPVDPGPHVVSATAPKKKDWSAPVTVVPKDANAHVTVALVDDPAAAAEATVPAAAPALAAEVTPAPKEPPSTPPDRTSGSNGSGLRTAGWVTAGAGVAGLAVGAVFGLIAKSKNDEALSNDGCTGTVCLGPNAQAGASASSDANSAATISTVAFIAGGVVAATGLALVLLAPSGPSMHVTAAVGSGYGGLSAYGEF